MKATDELKYEHGAVKVMLRILDIVSEQMTTGAHVETDDLDAMLAFFTVFADACHHGKEENHLFPAMESAGVPRGGGIIDTLLFEHARARRLTEAMKETAASFREGRDAARQGFAAAAQDYVTLLTRHIRTEEEVLFSMAENRLDAETDAALSNAFDALEQERIGPGRHAEFHALLERLDDKYHY
jgi:hemerythrin-like domain-containing protein